MTLAQKRTIQTYDHRLRDIVHTTGDADLVKPYGVPRSTAHGWRVRPRHPVVTAEVVDFDQIKLQAEILRLRQQVRKLGAVIYLLATLLRVLDIQLDRQRLPERPAKARLLRVIERVQKVLSLRGALRVRERGWCRPRRRIYPAKPTLGVRASQSDELWHVDLTIIKLLDGTRVYLHAVIDNYSRRILAWCLSSTFEVMNTVKILQQAAEQAVSALTPPTVVTGLASPVTKSDRTT